MRAQPGPGLALLMTLVLLGLQVVLGAGVSLAWMVMRHGTAPAGATVAIPPALFGAINVVAFAAIIAWAATANRGTFRAVWRSRRTGWPVWAGALVAVVGLVMVLCFVGNALARVVPVPKEFVEVFSGLTDLEANPVSVIFTVVLVASCGEEWVFRGYILRGLLDHLRPHTAVMASAVLFAVMHANFWQLPVGFGVGLLCGFAYLRTRSLVLCIGMHAANNSLALSLRYLPFTIAGVNDEIEGGPLPPWWFVGLGCVLLAAGWVQLARATRKLAVPPELPVEPASLPDRHGGAAAVTEQVFE